MRQIECAVFADMARAMASGTVCASREEAMDCVCRKKQPFALFTQPFKNDPPTVWARPPLERAAYTTEDVLVGFVGTKDDVLDVRIGSYTVCSLQIQKGQFKFAIDDRFPIPLICLDLWGEDKMYGYRVNLRFATAPPTAMFAFLRNDHRRFLVTNPVIVIREPLPRLAFQRLAYMFAHGAAAMDSISDGYDGQVSMTGVVPDMRAVMDERVLADLADLRRRFWDESFKQFVETTWHPSRAFDWCFAIDDNVQGTAAA